MGKIENNGKNGIVSTNKVRIVCGGDWNDMNWNWIELL